MPKHLELAARYYFEQHNFKLMLDGGVITHSGGETLTDLQIRTQAQMVF